MAVQSVSQGLASRSWAPGATLSTDSGTQYYIPQSVFLGGAQNTSGDSFNGAWYYPRASDQVAEYVKSNAPVAAPQEWADKALSYGWGGVSNPNVGYVLNQEQFDKIFGSSGWTSVRDQSYSGMKLQSSGIYAASGGGGNDTWYRQMDTSGSATGTDTHVEKDEGLFGGFGELLPVIALIGVGIATGGFGLAAGAVEAGAAAGLTVGEASALAAADAMAGIGATEFGVGAALEGAGALAGSAAATEAALPMSQVGALSNASTFGALGSGSMDLAVTGGLESGFGIGSAAAGTAPGMGALGSGLAGTTAAEVGTASIAPGLMSSIGAGAARGAITSAITGGDPIKGAMTGGITGGLMNTVGPVDTGFGQTADVAASAALRSAIGGGASAALSGGSFSDVLESSAIGGIVGGVTAGATELARSELPASELTGAFSGAVGGAAGGVTNALLTGGDAATQALIGGAAGGAGGLMSDIGLPSLAGVGSAVTGSLVGNAISQEPEQAPVQQPPSVVQEPTMVAGVSWGDFASPQFINIPRKDMNWGERVPWGQS